MDAVLTANKNTYRGVFLVTLSILVYEILLTRIFSVIANYHFAFMAISLAMFGMTLGAVLVYLLPIFQKNENTHHLLAYSSLLFSVSIVVSFLVLLSIPLQFNLTIVGILFSMGVFLLIAIPFIFSGICICLVLTKFSRQVSKLYAIDLLGAGAGCIAVIILLNIFSAPTVLFMVGVLTGLSAINFSKNVPLSDIKRTSMVCTVIFFLLAGSNIVLEELGAPLFRFSWIKNQYEPIPIYEKWNSFSRLRVAGNPLEMQAPFGWGFSSDMPKNIKSRFLSLTIDAAAETPLINYHNNINELNYFKYDVTNVAHYLRPHSDILIIGVGGGRDILSALAFQQHSIDGVEINPNILDLLTKKFANYTGHINLNTQLTLINDEARSFLTRSHKYYDIIQMSLIDTWAATSAGAFALTENSLYTTQSWQIFMQHLSSRGLLSVTRWFFTERPIEMYRLTVLASQALKNLGISSPEKNVMIFSSQKPNGIPNLFAATMLVSRSPFSDNDIKTAMSIAKKLHFALILSPSTKSDPIFASLVSGQDTAPIIDRGYLDLTPPTDDRPFFFQMVNLKSIFNYKLWSQNNFFVQNNQAVAIIGVLSITVTLLALVCILIPLFLVTQKNTFHAAGFLLTYFASIGLGFMFIEISQIQRLSIFLGHPTYGLSVVLFTLLISSGLGSLFTSYISKIAIARIVSLIILLIILGLFGIISFNIISHFQASSTWLRILIAVLMLFPVGFCMGVALPLGMQLANSLTQNLSPWLWSINGSMSICGSVFAIAIAFSQGISMLYWIGVLCYLAAFVAYCSQYFLKNKF